MVELLKDGELPSGFTYPPEFLRIVELGLLDLEPWFILQGDALSARLKGLAERYPARSLVPFARRQDNDDVACWDVSGTVGPIVIVHDFASPGSEQRRELLGFYDWLRVAVEDLIEFE